MMAGVSGIYDEPELYQLACAYRDVPAESGALLTWLDKHAKIPDGVRSVIELAAGPAEHARELAHRGLRALRAKLSENGLPQGNSTSGSRT